MGALLDLFKSNETGIVLDFENAKPNDEVEKAVHSKLEDILQQAEPTLEKVFNYGDGCKELIRVAIAQSNAENERLVWQKLVPNVELLKYFYEYSQQMTKAVPELLETLCKNSEQTLAQKQALAKQLGVLLDFALRFDDCKMKTIAIQNDFSHFRRTSNGAKMKGINVELELKDDLANRMSLFFASPTPIMTALVTSFAEFMKQTKAIDPQSVTNIIATLANVCCEMVKGEKVKKSSTVLFCLRTMTGCILLFDYLDKNGAFGRKTPIQIKNCIQVLKESKEDSEPLLNAIRFTSKTLKEAPEPIKELLK